MPSTNDDGPKKAGSMQSFKRCARCQATFVVLAQFEPATEPHVADVMCPHCDAKNPTAFYGRLVGEIAVRRGRRA
jgi:hypothetical protein